MKIEIEAIKLEFNIQIGLLVSNMPYPIEQCPFDITVMVLRVTPPILSPDSIFLNIFGSFAASVKPTIVSSMRTVLYPSKWIFMVPAINIRKIRNYYAIL